MLHHGDAVAAFASGIVPWVFAVLGLGAVAVVFWASPVAADAPAVPQSVGMMPASEAPPPEQGSAVPTVLQAGGLVLLAGGALTAARSWVSTEGAV